MWSQPPLEQLRCFRRFKFLSVCHQWLFYGVVTLLYLLLYLLHSVVWAVLNILMSKSNFAQLPLLFRTVLVLANSFRSKIKSFPFVESQNHMRNSSLVFSHPLAVFTVDSCVWVWLVMSSFGGILSLMIKTEQNKLWNCAVPNVCSRDLLQIWHEYLTNEKARMN